MPPPYDTVLSIGGQSLTDAVWRLFGPTLAGLSNPLPISLPGFTNAALRVVRIAPVVPPGVAGGGGYGIALSIRISAEALLNVNLQTGTVTVNTGSRQLSLTNVTGSMLSGSLTNITIGTLGSGTGSLRLGPANPPPNADLNGTLALGNIDLPGIPLPAIVPMAIDLTPGPAIQTGAVLQISVAPTVDGTTAFGVLLNVTSARVSNVALDPNVAPALVTAFQTAVSQLAQRLGIPNVVTQPTISAAAVNALLAPVPALVVSSLENALGHLAGLTGRVVFPPPAAGASCDARALPTMADASLILAGNGSFILQLGFSSPGSTDITAFPPFAPTGLADTTLTIGNAFLLRLLCCLVERLPGFAFTVPAAFGTVDVAGASHLMCCNFSAATLALGPISLNGGLSVCIDGSTGSPKTLSLVGSFSQGAPAIPLPLASIGVTFTVRVVLDLNGDTSLGNLRLLGPPTVTANVTPSVLFVIGLIALGTVSAFPFGALVGPALTAIVLGTVWAACNMAGMLLTTAVRNILAQASLVTSPVAIPPTVLDAFGRIVPATVTIDDLTAHGVLETPTSPWILEPREFINRRPPPPGTTTSGAEGSTTETPRFKEESFSN